MKNERRALPRRYLFERRQESDAIPIPTGRDLVAGIQRKFEREIWPKMEKERRESLEWTPEKEKIFRTRF